jgi:hypothetical protein
VHLDEVQTTLSRPGIGVAGYSLAIVVTILLIKVGRSHVTSGASVAAGVVAFLVLMILFLAALKLIVPQRYVSNPRFQRFDIALGFLSLASIAFVLTSLVLVVLATDGQSPAPTEFVVAALVAALAAGAINELARRRFPDAWTPATKTTPAAASRAAQAMTYGTLTIRPTRFARGLVVAFMGALTVVAIVGTLQGSTPVGGIGLAAFCVGFTALILWMSAGCSAEKVWFMWRTVDRSALGSIELTSRPGLAVDYGGLRLLGANGVLALTVPSLFFADDDIQKLIGALGLPLRSTGEAPNLS